MCVEGCGSAVGAVGGFETTGPPSTATFAVHALHEGATRILGSVDPNSLPTSAEQKITVEGAPTGGTFVLEFDGAKTKPIAFNAPAASVDDALKELDDLEVGVNGPSGGPYTVNFHGPVGEVAQPLIVADASGLTPSGSKVSVVTIQAGGVAYDASYHFEYVSRKQFEAAGGEGGFARAVSTPEVYLGGGSGPRFAGRDLPVSRRGKPMSIGLSRRVRLPAIR